MSTAFELARIFSYFVITCAGAYLFFDDRARHRQSSFVWLAIGVEHISMLVLLALDLQHVVDWFNAYRVLWIFTPTAAYVALFFLMLAALSMLAYAVFRWFDRRRAGALLAHAKEEFP